MTNSVITWAGAGLPFIYGILRVLIKEMRYAREALTVALIEALTGAFISVCLTLVRDIAR